MSATLQVQAPDPPAQDFAHLDRELDRTKSDVFRNSNAAFFGSLLCSLQFVWDEKIQTAATDGVSLWWSPVYFLKLPRASRKTDLMHELWHVARLHMQRRGDRDPKIWNIACDIRIDLDLEADGYTFEDIEGVLTWPSLDARKYLIPWTDANGKDHQWAEEVIYDDLVKNNVQPPPDYQSDIKQGTPQQLNQAINAVVKAIQTAKLNGAAGTIPGGLEEMVTKFLAPIVPWESLFHRWMTELVEDGHSWRKRNRRFARIYMPSAHLDEGALEHLVYYEDTSGSISEKDAIRFNSEFKYVKETFRPKKMSLVQFDTKITQELFFGEDDHFNQVKIVGRGGTSLVPVREHIIKHRPTAVVVFSDLQCEPMAALPFDIPVIWVVINNRGAKTSFGKLVHIR